MLGVAPRYSKSGYLDFFGLHSQCEQDKGESLKVLTIVALAKDQCDHHDATVSHAAAAATLVHHTSCACQMKQNMSSHSDMSTVIWTDGYHSM